MSKQHINMSKDRLLNQVFIKITSDENCDATKGEYSIFLISALCELELTEYGGISDIYLIKDAIENDFDMSLLNKDSNSWADVMLEESGEFEGNNWVKYFIIKDIVLF